MSARAAGNRPVLCFIFTFSGALGLYFLLTLSLRMPDEGYASKHPLVARLVAVNEWTQDHVFRPYQRLIASASSGTVNLFGYHTTVDEREIRSAQFAVTVTNGCDGIELSLLLAAAIVVFPASARRKMAGLAAGLILIALLNYLRVVSLWLIGVHWRAGFDLVHYNLWPLLLICVVLLFFVSWLKHATSVLTDLTEPADGAAQS